MMQLLFMGRRPTIECRPSSYLSGDFERGRRRLGKMDGHDSGGAAAAAAGGKEEARGDPESPRGLPQAPG